ncbi:MAG: HDIG domain-containing protein [Phycisphaeraceae bacterium]|nr:HDIG domain-containing protein [Phycisphaeraceae bacterium]
MQFFLRKDVAWPLLYIAMLTLLASFLAFTADTHPPYFVGQVVTKPIVSRVEFEAVNEIRTRDAKSNAREKEPAIYRPNREYLDRLREKLLNLGELGLNQSIQTIDRIGSQTRENWSITPEVLAELKRYMGDPAKTPWQQVVEDFIQNLASVALLTAQDYARELDPAQLAYQVIILHPRDGEIARFDGTLLNAETDHAAFKTLVDRNFVKGRFPSPLEKTILAIVQEDLQPLYFLDGDATRQRRDAAEKRTPGITDRVMARQALISVGHQLSSADLNLLKAERLAYQAQIGLFKQRLAAGARVLLILLIQVCVWFYIYRYRPRITFNQIRGLALTCLLGLGLFLAATGYLVSPDYVFFLVTYPTLIVAVVLAIAYDQRFALALGAAHILLVLVTLRLPLGIGLVLAAGVMSCVGQLNEVRNRSKLMWVGLWTGLAMAAVTWIVGLMERPLELTGELSQFRQMGWDSLAALFSGLGTGLVIQGALPAIESVFRVTTSMTLKELNDASHPLLRRLAQEAPGTYQHSLRLADLAETAADTIGAHGLLCKVGAMYHDIGKVNKPLYFVENQSDGHNRHEKLSPAMSLLIIVGHVKDGMEMARDFGLPPSLRHFIESHHGTTLVEYFFNAAKQRSDLAHTPAPTEFEFRYPGPKPQSREAAILMLGDAVESAARTLREPTPIRLEQLVHTIAEKRLTDGQFDEANLTLRELHQVEQSMAKTLAAIYHARIRYPGGAAAAPASGDSETEGVEDTPVSPSEASARTAS